MLRLYHGKILKVVSPRFTTLNWGRGGDEVCSVNVHQFSNLGWIGLNSINCDWSHGLCQRLWLSSIAYEMNFFCLTLKYAFKFNMLISTEHLDISLRHLHAIFLKFLKF